MTFSRLGVLAATALLLAGCAMLEPPQAELKPFADDFVKRLRWADYPGAARHFAARHQESFEHAMREREGDLKIVEARFEGDGLLTPDGRRPLELVVEYYLLPSTEIETARRTLEWVYLDYGWTQRGLWLIDSDFEPLR